MNRYAKGLLAILAVILLGALAFIWWQSREQGLLTEGPMPAAAVVTTDRSDASAAAIASTPASAPAIRYPIETVQGAQVASDSAVSTLSSADSTVRSALAELLRPKDALEFLKLDQFVRHVVATIDSLPSEHASISVWPVSPMPGRFSSGAGDDTHPAGPTTIHANNSERYSAFVTFVESIDTSKAVALYVRLYPLFQQAYVELGYPKAYFNDRLVAVIDHLLATPVPTGPVSVTRVEVKGPYPSVKPWVTYEFTDPVLCAMSAGQKMLIRSGSVNHQRLQAKLQAIRAQLTDRALNNATHS